MMQIKKPFQILWDKDLEEIPRHTIVPMEEATPEQIRSAIGISYEPNFIRSYIVPVF